MVVDSNFIEIAATQITVGALDLVRADDATVRPKLVQPGIEDVRQPPGLF